MKQALSLGLAMALVAASALGQAYRWIDKDGRVHYTQTPPPPDAKDVQRKKLGGNVAESSNLPFATQRAAQNFPVTLYTSPDCGAPCDGARSNLVKRGVQSATLLLSHSHTDHIIGFPFFAPAWIGSFALTIGSQVQSGFLEGTYKSALDDAGYPSSTIQVPLEALRKMEPVAQPAAAPPAESNPPPAPGAEAK